MKPITPKEFSELKSCNWYFEWTDKDGNLTCWSGYDRTEREAIEIVTGFGWTEPKWWQWRRWGDVIVCTDCRGFKKEIMA